MPKPRREFSREFKQEAVALFESSGRPLMQVATEVGISPSMLRNWRAVIRGGKPTSRAAAPAGLFPLPSLADQASAISRLKRELDRTRMERDVLKSDRHLRAGAEMSFNFIRDRSRPRSPGWAATRLRWSSCWRRTSASRGANV